MQPLVALAGPPSVAEVLAGRGRATVAVQGELTYSSTDTGGLLLALGVPCKLARSWGGRV